MNDRKLSRKKDRRPTIRKIFLNSLEHYDAIAENYDDLYGFWYGPLAELLIPLLKLSPDDKIADIGGGTGGIAEKILTLSGVLKNPICVVDPSQGLLQKAKERSSIISVLATADEFLLSSECHGYNKFLFCQSSHHLPNRKATFRAVHRCLQPGSMCVIIGGGKTTSLPLWKWARANFSNDMHDEADDLRSCGFDANLSNLELLLHVTKEQWYEKIRNRIFSIFIPLSDREIEAGITEIDKTLLFNVESDEEITIKHDMQCIVATKR